jgi:hypothetical protein
MPRSSSCSAARSPTRGGYPAAPGRCGPAAARPHPAQPEPASRSTATARPGNRTGVRWSKSAASAGAGHSAPALHNVRQRRLCGQRSSRRRPCRCLVVRALPDGGGASHCGGLRNAGCGAGERQCRQGQPRSRPGGTTGAGIPARRRTATANRVAAATPSTMSSWPELTIKYLPPGGPPAMAGAHPGGRQHCWSVPRSTRTGGGVQPGLRASPAARELPGLATVPPWLSRSVQRRSGCSTGGITRCWPR